MSKKLRPTLFLLHLQENFSPFFFLLLVLLPLILISCASMSKEECLTANWLDQGYRDGREGYPLSRLQDHYKACQEVGVIPEERDYRKGHSEGIHEYCRPERALIEGREGRLYRNACPARLESEFLYYYRAGKRVYEAEYYVERLSSEQQQLETQLRKEKDTERRKQLRREIRNLDHQLRDARRHLIREEENLPSPYGTFSLY